METSLKILLFLCFFSLSAGLQLFPSLSFNTPIGLNFQSFSRNGKPLNDNLNNAKLVVQSERSFALEQCFCFPKNSDNHLVTEHLSVKDQDSERLVVYFYKNNGILQAFIPNKQKQLMIPDLTFDEIDGDTLKPVASDLAIDIFESTPNIIRNQHQVQSNEVEETENDMSDTESNSHVNVAMIPPTDEGQETIESELDNHSNEEDNSLLQISDENNLLDEVNTSLEEHNTSLDHYNGTLDDQNESVVESLQLPAENPPINTLEPENTDNIRDIDQLNKILSMLPQDSRLYLQSLFPQLLYIKTENQKGGVLIKFDEWFKSQLSGIILQNLSTSSDVHVLKDQIMDVLKSNGMRVTNDGMLYDANGNLLKITNIKLRPILIGEPVESRVKVNDESNYKYVTSTEMSYLQLILVTLVNPPSLLGVVPVGKVYLPRDTNRDQKVSAFNKQNDVKSAMRFGKVGCKTYGCKLENQRFNKLLFSRLRDIPYFQLPLRRNSNNKDQVPKWKLPEKFKAPNSQAQINIGNEINKDSFENLIPQLVGIFGKPNLLDDQSRRILGGKVLKTHKPDPQVYSYDDAPGLRIIGGNPAISSGTPLVSKGRSGFETLF